MNTTTLKATNAGMKIANRAILKNIDIEISSGEFIVIVGPNGAGKSSLLKLLAGALEPSSGKVTLNGQELLTIHPESLSKQRAVLSQAMHIGFPLTVKEVIETGFQSDKPALTKAAMIEQALAKAEISHLKEQSFPSCSGGEQTRVHLARILVQLWSGHYPRQILFLDEPTSALDIRYQVQLLRLCASLCDEGLAIVCILHDLQLAAHFASKICVLQNGEIVRQGTPEEILQTSHMEQVYQISTSCVGHPVNDKPMVLVSP